MRYYQEDKSWYDIAQICLNGHIITDQTKTKPEKIKKYCDICGSKTITNCENCNTKIQGCYYVSTWPYTKYRNLGKAPSFCHECGKPYPWTEKRLKAAAELIELTEVSNQEKQSLKEDLPNLLSDNPRTTVAATKINFFLQKAGSQIGSALRDIFVDIASETAKKTMGL